MPVILDGHEQKSPVASHTSIVRDREAGLVAASSSDGRADGFPSFARYLLNDNSHFLFAIVYVEYLRNGRLASHRQLIHSEIAPAQPTWSRTHSEFFERPVRPVGGYWHYGDRSPLNI